jgi:hypothetical protein
MGMEVSWMSAGRSSEEVGIGRAGPVVAVMADGDGVLLRDHGDGDGHQGG